MLHLFMILFVTLVCDLVLRLVLDRYNPLPHPQQQQQTDHAPLHILSSRMQDYQALDLVVVIPARTSTSDKEAV